MPGSGESQDPHGRDGRPWFLQTIWRSWKNLPRKAGVPCLPHCLGGCDLCGPASRECARVSGDGQSVSSLKAVPPHHCTVKKPLLITWIRGPAARAFGPLVCNRPLCATDAGEAPLSPRSPASHPSTQRPLLWPPFSVSLWFSKGVDSAQRRSVKRGVLGLGTAVCVLCGQRGAQERGSHSPKGVYPKGDPEPRWGLGKKSGVTGQICGAGRGLWVLWGQSLGVV